jgi:hypothetical protein
MPFDLSLESSNRAYYILIILPNTKLNFKNGIEYKRIQLLTVIQEEPEEVMEEHQWIYPQRLNCMSTLRGDPRQWVPQLGYRRASPMPPAEHPLLLRQFDHQHRLEDWDDKKKIW